MAVLSTPNLDWVWTTHYRLEADTETKMAGALALNRAFHGWGHRFLWNREVLELALGACGFTALRFCRHGQSTLPLFQSIERHQTYPDTDELPHVLIVEAQPGELQPQRLGVLRDRVRQDLLDHMVP